LTEAERHRLGVARERALQLQKRHGTPKISFGREIFPFPWTYRALQHARNKEQVTVRIDADVLQWLRGQGKGYQTRLNALLRAWMEHEQHVR